MIIESQTRPARFAANILAAAIMLAACSPDMAGDTKEETGVVFFNPGNIPYQGIEDTAVQLTDGTWEGEPWVEGGASRPRVGLIKDFFLPGDLDNDGMDEAVVGLWQSSGGSGTFNYIALLDHTQSGITNTFTAPLGDRVKLEGGSIENGFVLVDVIQHGPDEPACCPTQAVTRKYDGSLKLISTTARTEE